LRQKWPDAQIALCCIYTCVIIIIAMYNFEAAHKDVRTKSRNNDSPLLVRADCGYIINFKKSEVKFV